MNLDEIAVRLSLSQLHTAAMVGVRRNLYALGSERRKVHGGKEPGEFGSFDNHIFAAMAEYAVALHFNLFWDEQVGTIDGVDVGGCIEVRSIREDAHRLILHERDRTLRGHLPFVLVLSKPPVFTLLGWITCADGLAFEFWTDPGTSRPAYFVPRSRLNPMAELTVERATALVRWREAAE